MAGLLGKKIGMTQIFNEQGLLIPVTVVKAGPCYVIQVKTQENDGYSAVQIAYDDLKTKNVKAPVKGHFAKSGVTPKRFLKEFEFKEQDSANVGDELTVDIFKVGTLVTVSGVSKGKGFQGGVKRHGFSGGPSTHGQSDRLRAPGSLGQSSYPSRVYKGLKMAGRMGNDRKKIKKVMIVRVDLENGLLFLKGPLPGAKQSLLEIQN